MFVIRSHFCNFCPHCMSKMKKRQEVWSKWNKYLWWQFMMHLTENSDIDFFSSLIHNGVKNYKNDSRINSVFPPQDEISKYFNLEGLFNLILL
mgnify:CR=1 FL=1